MNTEKLNQLTSQERLDVYNIIIAGCSHIWSKNEMQKDKALEALNALVPLTKKDPYFLAHLASYALTQTKNKDLQIFTTYVNSLSDADGSPFSIGSEYKKPNLRFISHAAVQMFDPKLALRILILADEFKYGVVDYLREAAHCSQGLRTALKRYLQYRENNPQMLRGIHDIGFNPTIRTMYKILRMIPNDEAAKIIHFKIKGKKLEYEKTMQFKRLTDLEVAKAIQKNKWPVLGVLSRLDRPISPVIAVALLEQATGNQAVIFRKTFEDAGVLADKEVMKLYQGKIATAKTALDRAETLSKDASEAVKTALQEARAESRKAEVGSIGKVFMHLDISGSMENVLDIAKKRGAILAEIVQNPQENFKWGTFNLTGNMLEIPNKFVEDAFAAKLYGIYGGGGTDAFSLYPTARHFNSDVDIFISDGAHNAGDLGDKIAEFHKENPKVLKPRVCVIVWIPSREDEYARQAIRRGYEANDIPVVVLNPDTVTQSALVAEAIRSAMMGPIAVIDDIMKTDLLKLPLWYFTI